jgi:hypothetical protein
VAELVEQSKTEIVPVAAKGSFGEMIQGDMGRYTITIREVDAAGKWSDFGVSIPMNEEWQKRMLLAAILKRTTWKQFEMPTIFHAIIYAERMGLDIAAGDVYQAAEGRLSTTAGAKIRHAMNTGKIIGYTVEITDGPVQDFKFFTKGQQDTVRLPNYKAKVTVNVAGWSAPMVYETDLSEWFEGRNPNWRQRTKYMLRRNALSKAFEEVAPMGVEADEAPPVIDRLQELKDYQTSLQAAAQTSPSGFPPPPSIPNVISKTKGQP